MRERGGYRGEIIEERYRGEIIEREGDERGK